MFYHLRKQRLYQFYFGVGVNCWTLEANKFVSILICALIFASAWRKPFVALVVIPSPGPLSPRTMSNPKKSKAVCMALKVNTCSQPDFSLSRVIMAGIFVLISCFDRSSGNLLTRALVSCATVEEFPRFLKFDIIILSCEDKIRSLEALL